MFNDNILKNNACPATPTSGYTNKLTWTSDNKSNVSTLGDEGTKTGLFAFNNSVKNSIKYVYLNNNNFSNVNALKDFKNIVELQMQCNSSLSNIDGLKDHGNLEVLTLHKSSLSELVDFSSEKEDKTKFSKLSKLTIQGNSSLGSLKGIGDCKRLVYLIANNCNLTDIDDLKEHSEISYLDLANNTSLEHVAYIQHCKALQYVYLDNNTKMIPNEVDIAFNGKQESYGIDILIKNCINGYKNIPSEYWELFDSTATVLDYSLAQVGELTVDSTKWIALKDRRDVTKLKLDGQTKLPMKDEITEGVTKYGLETVLKTLTGMKALSLYNCSQVDNISFVSGMTSLYEIDLRSVSPKLTNLSVLDSSKSLKRLIVNNPDIDATGIQNLINRFNGYDASELNSWNDSKGWNCSGYVAENDNFPDFSECDKITKFYGGNMGFDKNSEGVLDLSGTNVTICGYRKKEKNKIVLPETCYSFVVDNGCNAEFEFNGDKINRIVGNHINQLTLDNLSDKLQYCGEVNIGTKYDLDISDIVVLCNTFILKQGVVGVKKSVTLNVIESNEKLKDLELSDRTEINGIENIGNFNLYKLVLDNCNVTNISWITSLTDLKYLDLSNNNITDISSLNGLKNIGKSSEDFTVDSGACFYLNNNNISDLTPLSGTIDENGKISYTFLDVSNNALDGTGLYNNVETLLKLHKAGLNKVNISGNTFTASEKQDLIKGKEINGVSYSGFGEGNVIDE